MSCVVWQSVVIRLCVVMCDDVTGEMQAFESSLMQKKKLLDFKTVQNVLRDEKPLFREVLNEQVQTQQVCTAFMLCGKTPPYSEKFEFRESRCQPCVKARASV